MPLKSWLKEGSTSWSDLAAISGLGPTRRLRWFGYNLKLITANRLARDLTEAEGRRHPFGWLADRVERDLGQAVMIRRPV